MNGKSTIKTILVMVILILVGVLGVLGINTVRTYMSGAAVGYEPKGVNAKANGDGKSAEVTWTTEKPVMAIVEYGTTPASLLLRAVETSQETSHKVTISSLKPNVNYYYRIRVREKDNEDTIYDNNGIPFNFTTKVDASAAAEISPTMAEAKPSVAVAAPTVAVSGTQATTCNRTTDYNKDGTINSRDMIECMKNGGSTNTTASSPTPSSASGCNRSTDYNKDGVINNADWFKCLQDNPR